MRSMVAFHHHHHPILYGYCLLSTLFLAIATAAAAVETTAATPIGRWAGAARAARNGRPLPTSNFYDVEIEILSNGKLQLLLPSRPECIVLAEEQQLDRDLVQFSYERGENDEGCSKELQEITLTLVQGSEWSYSVLTPIAYADGILRYQCLNECQEGFYCNSQVDQQSADSTLNECLPIDNDFLYVGDFVGTVGSGDLGSGEVDTTFEHRLSILPNGKFIARSGRRSLCFNQEPLPVNSFGPGRVEVIARFDSENCGSTASPLIVMTHVEGEQWQFRVEYGERFNQGILTFQCSLEDCISDQACPSLLAEDNSMQRECIGLGSDMAGNTFRNNRLACPFAQPGPIDNPDLQLRLDVFQDTNIREVLSTGSVIDRDVVDETPETRELRGQEIYSNVPGCHLSMAAQQRTNSVCFSYEYYSLNSNDETTEECRVTCVSIGSSDTFEIYRTDSITCGFTLCAQSTVRTSCRIAVSDDGRNVLSNGNDSDKNTGNGEEETMGDNGDDPSSATTFHWKGFFSFTTFVLIVLLLPEI